MVHIDIDLHLWDLVMSSFYLVFLLETTIIQQDVQPNTGCLPAYHLANEAVFLVFDVHDCIAH